MACSYTRLIERTDPLGSKLRNEVLGTVIAFLQDSKIENCEFCKIKHMPELVFIELALNDAALYDLVPSPFYEMK